MPNLDNAVEPSTIFQPSLLLSVRGYGDETVSIYRRLAPRQTGTPRFVPLLASASVCVRVRRNSRSSVYAETRWRCTAFSLDAEMSNHATFPRVRERPHRMDDLRLALDTLSARARDAPEQHGADRRWHI